MTRKGHFVMKAITVETTSGRGALAVAQVAAPTPGPGEVVIDVAAAGVNRADLLQVRGLYPSPPGWPEWPGLEASGIVSAVGQGVAEWSVGDRVCALVGGGAYAEQIAVPADLVLPVPDDMDLVVAGGLMEAACTVWSNLRPHGAGPGTTLLVHGGSGGVGSFAVQLGAAMGMRVFATAGGPERASRVRDLGAELAIDYKADDFAPIVAAEGGADIVLDVVGGAYLSQNLEALAVGGTIVVIGRQQGSSAELDLGLLMSKWATVTGTTLRARPHAERATIVAQVQEDVWPHVVAGLRPVVHAVLPLDEAAEAHRLLASGEAFGKVLLTP